MTSSVIKETSYLKFHLNKISRFQHAGPEVLPHGTDPPVQLSIGEAGKTYPLDHSYMEAGAKEKC